MPRKARIIVPNCPHHIVQRGHNKNAVFVAEQDYQYYLENLKEFKHEFSIKVNAWCLMTNHVHLILEPGDDEKSISRLMKHLAGRQSAYVNKLEQRTGTLWEGRFKASPIQKDEYLLPCVRYIEMNPVRACMVTSADEYKWSSYHERTGQRDDGVLDLDVCYLGLSDSRKERIKRYKEFLSDAISETEMKLLHESVKRNQLTGNNRFTDEVEQRVGIRVENRGRGRPLLDK